MKLSIIIPAYNCENYIEQCILSLQNQDLDSETYEIIVINDGSSDNTLKLLTQLSKQYNNIVLKSQINSGVGSSRNNGLAIAKGTYIYFLDADDYVSSNILSKILSEAEKNDLEIIGFKSQSIEDGHVKTEVLISNSEQIELGTICDGVTYIGEYGYMPEIWWYFTKREFLIETGLNFYPRKFIQDSFYTPMLFLAASRIAFLPLNVHSYRLSNNSITRRQTAAHVRKHTADMIFAIIKLKSVVDAIPKKSTNLLCIKQMERKINYYVFLIFTRITKSDLTKPEVNSQILHFKNLNLYPIKSLNKKGISFVVYDVILRTIFNSKLLFHFSRRLYKIIK